MSGNSPRLRSKLDVRKGCHEGRVSLQLMCIRSWTSITVLWQPLMKGWNYRAGAQVLGADVAELSPRIKKLKIKPEIPQNLPG